MKERKRKKKKDKMEALEGHPSLGTTEHTHLEFLVPPQDLRAQREVVHRPFVIVVDDIPFPVPVLALVGRFRPRLALSLGRGLRAWRLCQLYALQRNVLSSQRSRSIHLQKKKGEGRKEDGRTELGGLGKGGGGPRPGAP